MRGYHPIESFGDLWENGLRYCQLAGGSAFRFYEDRLANC